MKFLIFGPPYRNSSAGIRVLHRLAAELVKRGQQSMVFTDWQNLGQIIPHVGDAIVVYPESVPGNPLQARNVVRYVLNTPGFMGIGDTIYPDAELVFTYTDALIPAAQSATSQLIDASRVMEISVIEPWLFRRNPEVKKQYDVALWIGKGAISLQQTAPLLQEYLQGKQFLQITYELPSTREGLALLFQSCHEFLTVDNFTAMLAEAKMCGCKTTIMTSAGPVDHTDDGARWATAWYDTGCIDNFVNLCRARFDKVAVAA